MTSILDDKPKRRRRAYASAFCAPYEERQDVEHGHHTVPAVHGGYGVLAEGYIVGPYFYYENATNRAAGLTDSRVVRWVDFVVDSTKSSRFVEKLLGRTEPFTVRVSGYGHPVRITTT